MTVEIRPLVIKTVQRCAVFSFADFFRIFNKERW
nr:MAG TPA: hypothetical protein [Caudoviricetes sp.]